MAKRWIGLGFVASLLLAAGESGPVGSGARSAQAQESPRGRAGSPPATAGRQSGSSGIAKAGRPAPPLALEPPPEPAPMRGATDLRRIPARQLAGVARRLYDEKKYAQAIPLLHYAVKGGAGGGYDLACDYALVGRVDAAFYWLQKAALDDGVDADWAGQDPDLEILREDARWPRMVRYLAACNAHWAASGHRLTTLVVPPRIPARHADRGPDWTARHGRQPGELRHRGWLSGDRR